MNVTAAFVRRVLAHPEGLLCALALDPSTLSRNRNVALYAAPSLRRAHRRARALRSLCRSLSSPAPDRTVSVERADDDLFVVLRVASLALTRRVLLEPLELSVLKVIVTRDGAAPAPALVAQPQDRQLVEAALARIALDPPVFSARCA